MVTAADKTVFAVTVQALVTYCVLFGEEQGVHEFAVLTTSEYVLPAVQALQVPLVPIEVVLPAA